MKKHDVGSLETNHEGYGAAIARLEDLKSQLGRLERQQSLDGDAIAKMGPRGLRQRLEDAARALIRGEAPATERADLSDVRARLDSFEEQRAVLRRAIELQQDATQGQLWDAREAVRVKCRPMMTEMAGRFVKQVVALGETLEEVESLKLAMRDAGLEVPGIYVPSLGGVGVGELGHDSYGAIASALYEAVEAGAIEANEIPSAWRRRWVNNRTLKTPADVARENAAQLERATAATAAEESRLAKAAACSTRRRR